MLVYTHWLAYVICTLIPSFSIFHCICTTQHKANNRLHCIFDRFIDMYSIVHIEQRKVKRLALNLENIVVWHAGFRLPIKLCWPLPSRKISSIFVFLFNFPSCHSIKNGQKMANKALRMHPFNIL